MALGYNTLFFIFTVLCFWGVELCGNIYGAHTVIYHFFLAILLTSIFNPLHLDKKKFIFWIVSGFLYAVIGYLAPKTGWYVWLYILFLLTAMVLIKFKKDAPYEWLIILGAIFFNLSVITHTGHTDIQYDFASCYNYIEYILDNNFLFWHENPILSRPSYSSYHPILHFFLAAGIIRFGHFFTENDFAIKEAAQILILCYMLWYYILASKILRLFKLKNGAYLSALAFLCFFPEYNAISGFFNNDCLLLPLQAGTVYYSLLYAKNGERLNLLYIFIFATLAALTKLSGIVVLPLTAGALLYRLWKNRNIATFTEECIFGIALLLGLAIWPVYQHFMLGVSADFVPPQTHLSLESYTLWQRFNPLGAFFYEKMYYNDFGINLWETMTKTAMFGQWDFSYRGVSIASILLIFTIIYKIALAILFIATFWLFMQKRNKPDVGLTLILFLGILTAHILFGLKHPYMCNQDYRYIAILTLPLAMILQFFLNVVHHKIYYFIIAIFALLSFLSAFVWWYIVLPI